MVTLVRTSEADLDFEAISIKTARPWRADENPVAGTLLGPGRVWHWGRGTWLGWGSALPPAARPKPRHSAALSLSSPAWNMMIMSPVS